MGAQLPRPQTDFGAEQGGNSVWTEYAVMLYSYSLHTPMV